MSACSVRFFRFVLCYLVVFGTRVTVQSTQDDASSRQQPDESFFLLCSSGDVEQLGTLLKQNPEWVNATTEHGESCLHLTGILGQTSVTKLLLELGANPNVRSTFEKGLRMHPLSWNVYGNHVDNAKLLLDYGAHVNADFDLVVDPTTQAKRLVTVLDIVHLIQGNNDSNNDFDQMEALLLRYGAKTMEELNTTAATNKEDL